jgi:capsular exopolysaccharide synthesis family protein
MYPSSPNRLQNIVLAAIIGLVGGLGLAFLFEELDSIVRDIHEMETITGSIVLGQIPVRRTGLFVNKLKQATEEAEAFRRLVARLSTALNNTYAKTILITSPSPGDGKSTIVADLAKALAVSNKSVLVIDADIRRPTIHLLYGLSNEIGLTNVVDQEISLAQAIQRTDTSGVSVLTSGLLLPQSSESSIFHSMDVLLKRAASNYDLVLVDSPAFLSVADSAIIATLVDGVVLVIPQRQSRGLLVGTCAELARLESNLIGIIVNRVTSYLLPTGSEYYAKAVVRDEVEASKLAHNVSEVSTNRPRRILLIDDDWGLLEMLRLQLRTDGYDVQMASSGREALQIAADWEPELILVDVMMPDMNGYELCLRLRNLEVTSRTPIIMLTAQSNLASKRDGFSAGVNDYIVKPFNVQELRMRMESQLKHTSGVKYSSTNGQKLLS